MGGCALPSCGHRYNARLFTFPKDEIRRQLWLSKCNLESVGQHARLCERHFDDSQFELKRQDGWKRLKFDAEPTLFPEPIRIFRMAREESELDEMIEVLSEKSRKRKSGTTKQSNVLNDSLVEKESKGDKSAVEHLMSENKSLLDDIEGFQTVFMDFEVEENSSDSTVSIKEEITSDIDPDFAVTVKKNSKRKKKSPRTVRKKRKTTGKQSGRNTRASASKKKEKATVAETADPVKPSDPDAFIALLKQWNELLKQELQEFENKHKTETTKNEILLETILELETENKASKLQIQASEQDIKIFEKNNKEMNMVIRQLEKHNKALANKVEELEALKDTEAVEDENNKLKLKLKELQSQNKVIIAENKSMLEEVEEFVNSNKQMSQVISKLEAHNKFINGKLVDENKAKAEAQHTYMKNHSRMSQGILELEKRNKAIIGKLQGAEAEKITMARKIAELEKVVENLKKGYLDVLQHPKKVSRILRQKRNVEEETTAMSEKIIDLEKVIEDLVRNEGSSNVRIEITKLKESEAPKPDS